YFVVSSQKVNEEKSAAFFSKNSPNKVSREVSATLGVSNDVKFGKYLGLPAEWGRSKSETFHFLIERITSKACHWKSLLLSQGGKETLATAGLQASPSYVFSYFMLPDHVLSKMVSLVARFWWSGDVNWKSIHWCSMDRLTNVKRIGGLGFISFREFNLAHLENCVGGLFRTLMLYGLDC
ncbi:Putative ribonuclease H protein At1g65750, partial [Linum perenne]